MLRLGPALATMLLLAIPSAVAAADDQRTIDDPVALFDLAGRILEHHNDLVGEQRGKLDEWQRKGREATERIRRAQREDGKAKARDQQNEAAAKIVALLEASPKLLRLELQPDRKVLPVLGPLELISDNAAILIRAEMKGDAAAAKLRASMRTIDFSGVDGETPEHTVEVAPQGVSLVLINLSHVPKARTSQQLNLRAGDRQFQVPLELRSPPLGRLRLTILSDDDTPTPAMIRLVDTANGQIRRPPNAVDIMTQFDNQGRQTSRRSLIVPGPIGGDYYCVPEPTDMELPAGEWEITVRRGIEHVPVKDKFSVAAEQVVEKSYQPRRWEDMRKLGWWSGDDHVHCRILSDGDARTLMSYAQAEDVHLCNVVKMGDIFRTWFDQRGFGPAFRVIDKDYILSPGQECPRTHGQIGHTISMNIKRMVRDTDQYYLYDTVFDQVHADGGLSGYAHVNNGMFFVHRDMSINIPKGKIDFAEVLQFAHLGPDLWYRFLNAGFKVTASAGSDIPWGGTLGEVRVYSYLDKEPFTADAWFKAMGKGRTFVTNGPMLEMTVDDALPGDELVVETDRKVRVKARAWGSTDHIWPAKLVIVQHGKEIKVVESATPTGELKIDLDLDAAGGFWIAAHAVGQHGEHAHTTPTYVMRPGLRFWKHEDADKLIDQAMGSLDEIEKIVAEARDLDAQGKLEADRTRKQLALQGPALLERVAAARKIWEDLRDVAKKEAPLRAKLGGK